MLRNKKVRKVLGKIRREYFLEKEEKKKVKNMKIYKNLFNNFCRCHKIRNLVKLKTKY